MTGDGLMTFFLSISSHPSVYTAEIPYDSHFQEKT